MFETELKFQVPAARWAALRKAVGTPAAVQTRLQALYVETPGHDLAAAGLALRLRKEGRIWKQTLKGRGDGLMQRIEHEVRLPAKAVRAGGLPVIDPALHDGTPAGAALRAALAAARAAGHSDELRTLYRTDIQRLHRRVRHAGAVVEIALDHGAVLADVGARAQAGAQAASGRTNDGAHGAATGAATRLASHAATRAATRAAPGAEVRADAGVPPRRPPRRSAVAEIEFELISGPPQALATLAARWAARFDLWWDVRTKSERGFRLALGRDRVPATKAASLVLPPGDALACVLGSVVQSALAQALPNLAEIAGAPAQAPAAPEHLHQLRVALRRLRTGLLLFADWAPDREAALALQARWQAVFQALGAARDADVLATVWLPRLQAAGAPPLAALPAMALTPLAPPQDPGASLRTPAVTVLLLDTLSFALSLSLPATAVPPVLPAGQPEPPLPTRADAAQAVLQCAWRQAWADARGFATAPLIRQHRARKRLKRLRYALEFVAALMPPKRLMRWQRALTRALSALGDHNDLQVAREHFQARAGADPQAWFAVGWLAAQNAAAVDRAVQALARLQDCPRPWRGGRVKARSNGKAHRPDPAQRAEPAPPARPAKRAGRP